MSPDELPDSELEIAQAEIRELRDEVARLRGAIIRLSLCEHELGSVRIDRAILQQRVAHLEGERGVLLQKQAKMFEYQCPKAPPSCLMCGNVEEFAIKHLEFGSVGKRPGLISYVTVKKAELAFLVKGSFLLCKACADLQADHARVLGLVQEIVNAGVSMEDPRIAYKEVQIDREWFARAAASLPAQPAQGGASKPVTTCNRHSDCDAADEKARAKGALHADHCHDDCCSECFGN